MSDSASTSSGLTSLLVGQGYHVHRACTAHAAWAGVRALAPSAVIIDGELPDMPSLELCRQLHGDWEHASSIPVILVNGAGGRRLDRLTACVAGAWSVCPAPVDAMLLLLKLRTFVQARRAWARAERLAMGDLLDPETGAYSLSGLLWRASELQSMAAHRREPVACVGVSLVLPAEQAVAEQAVAAFAHVCRAHVRDSDVLGRVSAAEFVILAADADAAVAAALVRRLREVFAKTAPAAGARELRTAFEVITDCAASERSVADMLLHVAAAVRERPTAMTPQAAHV